MHQRHTAIALLCAVGVLALAACGGGSGTPAPEPDPTPATKVVGTASGPGGALDDYVSVQLTPVGGGAVVQLNTNASGQLDATVAADTYDVLASRPGYEDYPQAGFVVIAEQNNTLDFTMVPLLPNTYIGSANCGVCHTGVYDTFMRSAHPYKLNKVENGVAPSYPFGPGIAAVPARLADDGADIPPPDPLADPNGMDTDNVLGTPSGWSAITYVIGGFYWKARFLDANGYIVTGTEVQYNYETDGMVAYHNNEHAKTYNCGNCHTTGWMHWDDTVNDNRQDGLAGMDGTFAAPGVHCEACHGAGSTHAQTELRSDITEVATTRTLADFQDGMFAYGKPIACGECHTRDGERDHPTFVSAAETDGWTGGAGWPAMGGRVKAKGGLNQHHEQYDEILGLDPDVMPLASTRSDDFRLTHGDCKTCHTSVHTTTVWRDTSDDAPGVELNCSTVGCHSDVTMPASSSMRDFACTECHMPPLAKSAVSTGPTGTKPILGDVASHIFRIDMTQSEQFSGSYSKPYITKPWACLRCHNDQPGSAHDRSSIDDTGYVFHTP